MISVTVNVAAVKVYEHTGPPVPRAPEDQAADALRRWGDQLVSLNGEIQLRVELAVASALARGSGAGSPSDLINYGVQAAFSRLREEGLIIDGQWTLVQDPALGSPAGKVYIPPRPRIEISVDVPPNALKILYGEAGPMLLVDD